MLFVSTKIQGETNSESFYKLHKELKANAQAVYSNLSDGAHGHLALVLSDAQYALLVTAQPFVPPVHPGPLAIPDGTTGSMSTVLKEAHHKKKFASSAKSKASRKPSFSRSFRQLRLPTFLQSVTGQATLSEAQSMKSLHTSKISMTVSHHK